VFDCLIAQTDYLAASTAGRRFTKSEAVLCNTKIVFLWHDKGSREQVGGHWRRLLLRVLLPGQMSGIARSDIKRASHIKHQENCSLPPCSTQWQHIEMEHAR
jgi:hypothetical protein